MRKVTISNAAKAIIIRDDHLLSLRIAPDADGDWYVLPGGGQEPGETLHDTMRRECLEEIGIDVDVGELAFVREYVGPNHEFAHKDGHVHRIEFMFICRIPDDSNPSAGSLPDTHQEAIEWLPLAQLDRYRLYPLTLRPLVMRYREGDPAIYLGDIN